MINKQLIRTIAMVILTGAASSMNFDVNAQAPLLGKSSVKAVVKAMTLEEKVKLVVGTGKEFSMEFGEDKD